MTKIDTTAFKRDTKEFVTKVLTESQQSTPQAEIVELTTKKIVRALKNSVGLNPKYRIKTDLPHCAHCDFELTADMFDENLLNFDNQIKCPRCDNWFAVYRHWVYSTVPQDTYKEI